MAMRPAGVLMAGLIGCGGIVPFHIRAYQKIKNVEIVGVCDLNLERAKSIATMFQIDNAFTDYWDLIEKDLDLVDICTPISTHARIVCDVAKAVPAILVEKPMALTVSECDEMIKEVNKYGSKLCIGHNQIFSPHIQKAKSLVDSGEFNLFSFRTTQKESFELLKKHNLAADWTVTPAQKGVLWEVCCHLAYLQLHFLPDITEVYAVGGKIKYPVYDDLTVLLRTLNERYGLIELSWVSKETDITYEIRDYEGNRYEIYRDFDYFLKKTEEPPFTVSRVFRNILVDEKRLLQKWWNFTKCYFNKRKILSGYNLISSYIHSIEKDVPPPIKPKDGKNTINLLECIEKSLNEERSVSIKNLS